MASASSFSESTLYVCVLAFIIPPSDVLPLLAWHCEVPRGSCVTVPNSQYTVFLQRRNTLCWSSLRAVEALYRRISSRHELELLNNYSCSNIEEAAWYRVGAQQISGLLNELWTLESPVTRKYSRFWQAHSSIIRRASWWIIEKVSSRVDEIQLGCISLYFGKYLSIYDIYLHTHIHMYD